MADSIEVVRVVPQYSVVDLNKKRKNQSISANFELSDSCYEVPTVNKREKSSSDLVRAIETNNEHHPGEEEDAVNSKIRDYSSPELILEDSKTVVTVGDVNIQTSESNVAKVRSDYMPLMVGSLDSYQNPQSSHYEELNYCTNKPPTDKKKFIKSKRLSFRYQLVISSISILFVLLLTAACSSSVFSLLEISRVKSQLAVFSTSSEELQHTVKELMINFQQRYVVLENKTQQLLSTLDSLGQPSSPAASCAALLSSPSGHYWVRSSNGSDVHVYCDVTRSCGNVTGGWTRVGSINITENDTQCPGNLLKREYSNTCGVEIVAFSLPHCSSVNFSVNSIRYSKVCGKIKAFPVGSLEVFHGRFLIIDYAYVDGISLTHGHPRQHIWIFIVGTSESNVSCPCTNNCEASSTTPPPSFVGKGYFCDTGIEGHGNPLLNGGSNVAMNTCSSSNSPSPPWFYRDLLHTTTDDIELRVCVDEGRSNEDIAIETIEIYVQ